MPAQTDHPCFFSPSSPEIKVWRYMDFTKFVSLLDTESLFFSRSDLFDDPYEGATSHANIKLRPIVYKDRIPAEVLGRGAHDAERSKQWTYINCWHMNEYESAAMWKLYAQANEAVAIQSTFKLLQESLPDNVYLGVVNYIDYETEWLPEGNTFWPYVHKRKAFEHERELRGVIQDYLNENSIIAGMPNPPYGKCVEVPLSTLIQKVYISPTAPSWFADLVSAVVAKYGLAMEVSQSLMSKQPAF